MSTLAGAEFARTILGDAVTGGWVRGKEMDVGKGGSTMSGAGRCYRGGKVTVDGRGWE